MDVVTYSLKTDRVSSDKYYLSIAAFTDRVLKKGEQMLKFQVCSFHTWKQAAKPSSFEEGLLELLIMGVYWNVYIDASKELKGVPGRLLATVNDWRDGTDRFKLTLNKLKGLLSTLFISKRTYEKTTAEKNTVNLEKLLVFLKATGEFKQEVKRLESWLEYLKQLDEKEAVRIISSAVTFAEWFRTESRAALDVYTSRVQDFISCKWPGHRWKEDYVFCGSPVVEYHLNMVGAEIMNRIYHAGFMGRKEKVLLLPHCMTKPSAGKCQARSTGRGYVCTGCSADCQVNSLTRLGKKKNFQVRIVPHESSIASTKTDDSLFPENAGVIGVSCVLNLISGGWMLVEKGVAPQCVLLDYCGCKNHWHEDGISTALNEKQLMKILESQNYLHL